VSANIVQTSHDHMIKQGNTWLYYLSKLDGKDNVKRLVLIIT